MGCLGAVSLGSKKRKICPHCGDFVAPHTLRLLQERGEVVGEAWVWKFPLCRHSMARRDLPLAVSFPKRGLFVVFVFVFSMQCCSILLALPAWWLALTKTSVYLPRLLNRELTYWANTGNWAAWLGTCRCMCRSKIVVVSVCGQSSKGLWSP